MRSTTPTITTALASNVRTPETSAVLSDPFDRPHAQITNGNSGRSAILYVPSLGYIRAYVNQPVLGSPASPWPSTAQRSTSSTNATRTTTSVTKPPPTESDGQPRPSSAPARPEPG